MSMNRVMFICSLVGIWVFAVLLLITVMFPDLLKTRTRAYINQRIEPGVTLGIEVMERTALPLLMERYPEAAPEIATEVARYRQGPAAYIDAVTTGRMAKEKEAGPLIEATETVKAAVKRACSVSGIIADHFRRVFEKLILDLQIFAVSNIVGFLVVVWLTHGLSVASRRLQIQAFILFVATGYAMSAYINQNWFFNLLLDMHMGLFYPLLILATCLDLWHRWRKGQLRKGVRSLAEDMVG